MKELAKYIPESIARPGLININLRKSSEPSACQLVSKAAVDHFPQILSLAQEIVEIQKCKAATDEQIRLLEEKRKHLAAEAEAYALQKNADTRDMVSRMNCIREMLQDFYRYNERDRLSSEDFRLLMTSLIENLGAK